MDALIKQFARNLADEITKQVLENVRRELSSINKENHRFCYSEEEAAEKLGVNKSTLYKKRKSCEIDYTCSPSGKPVYLPRHIEDYLLKHEVRAA